MNQDVLLFAFANNHAKPLPTLQKEYEELNQILEDRNYNSNFHTTMFPFASVDDFTENIIKYRKKLFLFHFAGHAGPQKLEYLDINAHVRGISYLLSQCPNLKLVFLNGFSTIDHVNALLESVIPVIIATIALV